VREKGEERGIEEEGRKMYIRCAGKNEKGKKEGEKKGVKLSKNVRAQKRMPAGQGGAW